jgi:hypothetical protein
MKLVNDEEIDDLPELETYHEDIVRPDLDYSYKRGEDLERDKEITKDKP